LSKGKEDQKTDKLMIPKLMAYLMTEPLPGFDDVIDKQSLLMIFKELDRYREVGVPYTVFRSWVANASEEGSGDFLNKKNVFSYLLQVIFSK